MAHNESRWVSVANVAGRGLLATNTVTSNSFSFNCSHYTAEMLTKTPHDFELEPLEDTVVCLDYRHNGIGSNSCGPQLNEKWRFDQKSFIFSVRLIPEQINDVDPFDKVSKN